MPASALQSILVTHASKVARSHFFIWSGVGGIIPLSFSLKLDPVIINNPILSTPMLSRGANTCAREVARIAIAHPPAGLPHD